MVIVVVEEGGRMVGTVFVLTVEAAWAEVTWAGQRVVPIWEVLITQI